MNTTAIILLIVLAMIVVVAMAFLLRQRRSKRLRSRFGPEYSRAVVETGGKTQAEAKLEQIEKRVEHYKLTPLSLVVRADFLSEWRSIQARFVDDPRNALTEADALIQKTMSARGYPMADFDQRAADISVDHPQVVEHYRAGREISVRHAQGRASTEDMRQAMIHYRKLFAELVGEPEMAQSATVASAPEKVGVRP
jgi:hypothetical protein